MKTIFITGATGNVGKEVINGLLSIPGNHSIIAGVRDIGKDRKHFPGSNIQFQHFDFTDAQTFDPAFSNCDVLFLLRPPQIADVGKYFAPLIQAAKTSRIGHIVFLSVQGVEHSSFIPHHKIETLIANSGIPYTFIRPAYFMQNFTTNLNKDLVEKRQIFLPAGKARFTLIDVCDIGRSVAAILCDPNNHKGKSYELTSNEPLTFAEMAQKISSGTGVAINYQSPNLLHFFMAKRKQGVPVSFILVMIMLHYLPRFQKTPRTTDFVKMLTGSAPKTFDAFVAENKSLLR